MFMKKKFLIILSMIFLFALSSPQIALARAGGGHGGGHSSGVGSSSGGGFHSGGSGGHIGRYGGISTLVMASSYGIICLFLKREKNTDNFCQAAGLNLTVKIHPLLKVSFGPMKNCFKESGNVIDKFSLHGLK